MKLYYDFHIHSCLSPCGDDDSTPANIVGMCHIKGLNAIAVSDHNSVLNVPAVITQAERFGITVLPAMEITTAEDIHVLTLFPDLNGAKSMYDKVSASMMNVPNCENIFGKQRIMDAEDHMIGREERLLIVSSNLSLEEVRSETVSLGGVPVLAHIDKTANSALATLGAITEEMRFTVLEISKNASSDFFEKNAFVQEYKILRNSDAHYLWDISEAEHFIEVKDASPETILAYLRGSGG